MPPAGGRVVHQASGLGFPERLPGVELESTHLFDASGTNGSAAYRGTGFRMAITVFVYPRAVVPDRTVEGHFQAALGDIHHVHPTARLESAGPTRVMLAGEPVQGLSAFLALVNQGDQLGSWLLVVADGDYIVKVRATYARAADGAADEARLAASWETVGAILAAVARQPPAASSPALQGAAAEEPARR